MNTPLEQLEQLLSRVRNESPEDFADLFYAVAYEVGVDFSDATTLMDFMAPERLSEQLHMLHQQQGLSMLFLVSGVLARTEVWLSYEATRSRRQWRALQADLAKEYLPSNVKETAAKAAERLLSKSFEERLRAMRERYHIEKAKLFTESHWLQWEEEE